MYTRCPKCQALYPVETKDLRAGRGDVVCGRCDTLFNALDTLADQAEQARDDAEPSWRAPVLGKRDEEPLVSLRAEPRRPAPADQLRQQAPQAEERFGEPFPRRAVAVSPLWGTAVLVASVALGGQILFFESDRLAQRAALRPWLERLCPVLGCRVSEFRDLSHIEVVERGLTPARDGADGVEFRAVLANYADRPQPYPSLKLALTQFNGEPFAERIFEPRDYLPEPALAKKMLIGAAVEIRLTIANPGGDVGGFTFELL